MKHISMILFCAALMFSSESRAYDKASPAKAAAAKTEATALTFENKLVDGKKTWLPAIAKIQASKKVSIKLVNTLPEPHGFEIPGHITEIVGANETKTVVLDEIKKGETLAVKCQLHPAHVGAKIQAE